MWWSYFFRKKQATIEKEKALSLWLNCSLGLLVLLANREETVGAWIDFKKPVLADLPTLDIENLSIDQRKELAAAYDKVCSQPLLPFPQMNHDEVRAEIDRVIARALKLPDFSILRELLAQEPVVCLNRL